jgi:hypothetical protein
MSETKLRLNLDGLEAFKKGFGASYRTRVGVLGEKAARTQGGISNAELGVIQMFGSYTKGIPPRDFLLMPLERNRKEIIKQMNGSSEVRVAVDKKNYRRVFQLLGLKAEQYINAAFTTGGFGQWPPNAPATVAAKGSSSPLIDTGELRRSISSDVIKKGSV